MADTSPNTAKSSLTVSTLSFHALALASNSFANSVTKPCTSLASRARMLPKLCASHLALLHFLPPSLVLTLTQTL